MGGRGGGTYIDLYLNQGRGQPVRKVHSHQVDGRAIGRREIHTYNETVVKSHKSSSKKPKKKKGGREWGGGALRQYHRTRLPQHMHCTRSQSSQPWRVSRK